MRSLPLHPENVSGLPFAPIGSSRAGPAVFRGTFSLAGDPVDTYVAVAGWTKGIAWVNGFTLGRYWETMGPQHTLYCPAALLRNGLNELIVLELFNASAAATVVLRDAPEFLPPGTPCNPAGAPAPGSRVVMFACAASDRGAQEWLYDGGAMRVAGSPALCLAGGPARDPSTGNPAAQLATCAGGAAGQGFVYNASGTQQLVERAARGWCVDITGHATGDDAPVELYACNGGTNQAWTLDPTAPTTVVSSQPGSLCLTVCGS